ncbi:SRPBCC family protein [Sorangium sp. So ce1335]|uniref:SRPBCC family protein n=1 Tax=Sorangium sp. So ce1335 TaxID=3133335 RepID=UPI003F5DD2AA
MSKPEFVYVTYIASTLDKVWEALTTGEFTRQYWGGRTIQSEWKPGSAVKHIKEDGSFDWEGEVLQADRPKLLAYTFGNVLGERPSRVTFELAQFGPHVKLTLTHDRFDEGSKVLPAISNGWPAILSSMKSLLETGKALYPEWR